MLNTHQRRLVGADCMLEDNSRHLLLLAANTIIFCFCDGALLKSLYRMAASLKGMYCMQVNSFYCTNSGCRTFIRQIASSKSLLQLCTLNRKLSLYEPACCCKCPDNHKFLNCVSFVPHDRQLHETSVLYANQNRLYIALICATVAFLLLCFAL